MSALRIGTTAPSVLSAAPAAAAPPAAAGAAGAAAPPAAAAPAATIGKQAIDALGALVKWLPAEIVAGYAAVVTAMQPEQAAGAPAKPPSISWTAWVVALIATPILVLVGAWTAGKLAGAVARMALSVPAFALWSATIPHSVWEKWDAFTNNRPLLLFVLLIVVSIFTAIAQKLAPDDS
jgi:hypothetical protein